MDRAGGLAARSASDFAHQIEESERLALHDPVTELPNRILFHDRAQEAIAATSATGTGVAVLLLDLNRFKEVNDTLGHHNGDLLLAQVGMRLEQALPDSDAVVARLGGDEFAVLLPPPGPRLRRARDRIPDRRSAACRRSSSPD